MRDVVYRAKRVKHILYPCHVLIQMVIERVTILGSTDKHLKSALCPVTSQSPGTIERTGHLDSAETRGRLTGAWGVCGSLFFSVINSWKR